MKPKVTKDGGKENAVQSWKNIFSSKNRTSEEDKNSQPKKRVLKKSKTSNNTNSNSNQSKPMMNFLVARDNKENH